MGLLSLGAEPVTVSGIRPRLLFNRSKNSLFYDPYSPLWLALGLHFHVETRNVNYRDASSGNKNCAKTSMCTSSLVHDPDDLPITHRLILLTKVALNDIEVSQLQDQYVRLSLPNDSTLQEQLNKILEFSMMTKEFQIDDIILYVQKMKLKRYRDEEKKRQQQNYRAMIEAEDNIETIRQSISVSDFTQLTKSYSRKARAVSSRRASIFTRSMDISYLARIL